MQDQDWIPTKDADLAAFSLMKRHYSYRPYADGRRNDLSNPNRYQFVGPGDKFVMISPRLDALFVWRKYIDDCGQTGVNCAVFHNESKKLSSLLILSAEVWAREVWPEENRMYTYVDRDKVKSGLPGYCFLRARWKYCGETKSGKLIMEKYHARLCSAGHPGSKAEVKQLDRAQ